MPAPDSITIQLVDLDNIIQLVTQQQFPGGTIHIVDSPKAFIIRDRSGMQVGVVTKTEYEDS